MKQSVSLRKRAEKNQPIIKLTGIGLILIGLLTLLDHTLGTGWMVFLILPFIGLTMVVQGYRSKRVNLIVYGAVILCLSIGGLLAIVFMLESTWVQRAGAGVMALGASFIAMTAITLIFNDRTSWWGLVPGGVLASAGACMVFSRSLSILGFINYIALGLGIALVIWGVGKRLIGLIIPGSLLLGIGPGIYQAWHVQNEGNALASTGTMLVWFALGWILIILFSRVFKPRFIWWPLIPAGVFAIVGWSLFISADPGSALVFISNTGSIGVIILGIYLLLLRRGIGS